MKQILILLCALMAVSCIDYAIEVTPVLNETGEVVAKDYTASMDGDTSSVGITTNGDLTFSGGDVHIPESFSIVFTCEHGAVFTVKNKQVYSKLKIGDKVTITYKERYKNYKDGRRVLIKIHFIDANKQ